MNSALQAQEAIVELRALKEKLDEIASVANRKVNVFDAAGMVTQEVKHSHFFAWLLDPKKPHGLGTAVLSAFVKRLIAYRRGVESDCTENSMILKPHTEALEAFCDDSGITVETEKVLISKESRMDIYIESPATHTVLVIENKVFTGTHDDQLLRYENELSGFDGWHKIFVYLTPFGELPTNENGEYNSNWCVFDYASVLEIVKEFLKTLSRKKENTKLKFLLEDYMDLVETNILKGNKELRALCKQIVREHSDALRILEAYTDSAEEIIDYCKKKLCERYDGIRVLEFEKKKVSFRFYTEVEKDFFSKCGEDIGADGKTIKCAHSIFSCDGGINVECSLYKERSDNWSPAQKHIMKIVAPTKREGDLFFRFYKQELLDEESRYTVFDEQAKAEIDAQLQVFVDKIRKLDEKLLQ